MARTTGLDARMDESRSGRRDEFRHFVAAIRLRLPLPFRERGKHHPSRDACAPEFASRDVKQPVARMERSDIRERL